MDDGDGDCAGRWGLVKAVLRSAHVMVGGGFLLCLAYRMYNAFLLVGFCFLGKLLGFERSCERVCGCCIRRLVDECDDELLQYEKQVRQARSFIL